MNFNHDVGQILRQNQYGLSKLDMEVLLAEVLQISRAAIYAHPEYRLNPQQQIKLQNLFAQRSSGIPIAYILGKKEFWGLEFTIDKSVLIPRPETEQIIEIILEKFNPDLKIKILDLGTGSGALAIALAKELGLNTKILATDKSIKALEIAQANANKFNCKNIEFLKSDWFTNINKNYKFDIIISNPPYIDKTSFFEQTFEPPAALFAEKNGLADLEHIIIHSKNYLVPSGVLLLEHGYDQGGLLYKIMLQNNYKNIKNYQDLAGLDRVILGEA